MTPALALGFGLLTNLLRHRVAAIAARLVRRRRARKDRYNRAMREANVFTQMPPPLRRRSSTSSWFQGKKATPSAATERSAIQRLCTNTAELVERRPRDGGGVPRSAGRECGHTFDPNAPTLIDLVDHSQCQERLERVEVIRVAGIVAAKRRPVVTPLPNCVG
jgi:hypothetical protein